MVFPNLLYSYYSWYMGTNRAMYMVLWKVPCCESDRKDDELIKCVYQSTKELPLIGNKKRVSTFYDKYKHIMGGNVPSFMLKSMYSDLSKDVKKSDNLELEERILKYCLSNGDKHLWPDLQAANSGASEQYSLFF